MAAADIMEIENNLRNLALTKRMRVTEFFKDYDNLRSGYVTRNQFFRCLGQTLGVVLTPEQQKAIENKFNLKYKDKLNYKYFCDEINKDFIPNDVKRHPEEQAIYPKQLLGTDRSMNQLDPEQEKRLDEIITRMRNYYKYHMFDIKSAYGDFDVHNKGIVNETQFYRGFPGPEDIKEKDRHLLVLKYRDPMNPGIINYLNLDRDIKTRGLPPYEIVPQTVIEPFVFDYSKDKTFNDILDKIRIAVYKYGIRTTDFFSDYDPLHCGAVTENQFRCAMVLCVGKQAQLSSGEIQKIIEFYRRPDGHVYYKEFCDMMENVFNIPNLEKKPMQHPERPRGGTLFRPLATFDDEDEERLKTIIKKLAERTNKRRIMLFPYFKDFDKSVAYTQLITPSQFHRILNNLGFEIPQWEFELLRRKFADPTSGDINYPAFVQSIDQQYVGHTTDIVNLLPPFSPKDLSEPIVMPGPLLTIEEFIARVRLIVMTKRLQLKSFFEDFDALRSGRMTKSRFRRCLDTTGLSKLRDHDLTPGQFAMLCARYQDPEKEDHVIWTKFVDEINQVFTIQNLEKLPTLHVPEMETYLVPKPGTGDWEKASDVHQKMLSEALRKITQRIKQRRILCWPVFEDFDRHKRGHISIHQFRQALATLLLDPTEQEMQVMEARYGNDSGVDYKTFLNEVDPVETEDLKYIQRQEDVRRSNIDKTMPAPNICADLECLLLKLKKIIARRRMRPIDFFRDFDKLNTGRVLKTHFRRGLDISGYGLQESEFAILEDHFQSAKDADCVEYLPFCDELESVFTVKHLEKMPQATFTQFDPPKDWAFNELDDEREKKLNACLLRIADKVYKRQLQLFPFFEDFDNFNKGYVSQGQFRRVLKKLDLEELAEYGEIELMCHKYSAPVGGRDDVNYIAFCHTVYRMANVDITKP